MKRKIGRPRGSGPAQVICAVLPTSFILRVRTGGARHTIVRVARRPVGCKTTGYADKAKGVFAGEMRGVAVCGGQVFTEDCGEAVSGQYFGDFSAFYHVYHACQSGNGTEGFLICHVGVVLESIHFLLQEYQKCLNWSIKVCWPMITVYIVPTVWQGKDKPDRLII